MQRAHTEAYSFLGGAQSHREGRSGSGARNEHPGLGEGALAGLGAAVGKQDQQGALPGMVYHPHQGATFHFSFSQLPAPGRVGMRPSFIYSAVNGPVPHFSAFPEWRAVCLLGLALY